jgi:urea transporter
MYQDITNRPLYGYLILIVGTSVLSFLSDFFGNFKLIIIGNLVSIIISFCFIHWMGFDGRPYGWADNYFKPFGVNLSLFVFSLLNLIPQLLAMFVAKWIKPNRKKTLN